MLGSIAVYTKGVVMSIGAHQRTAYRSLALYQYS